jgi:hypothetical protein
MWKTVNKLSFVWNFIWTIEIKKFFNPMINGIGIQILCSTVDLTRSINGENIKFDHSEHVNTSDCANHYKNFLFKSIGGVAFFQYFGHFLGKFFPYGSFQVMLSLLIWVSLRPSRVCIVSRGPLYKVSDRHTFRIRIS